MQTERPTSTACHAAHALVSSATVHPAAGAVPRAAAVSWWHSQFGRLLVESGKQRLRGGTCSRGLGVVYTAVARWY